MELSKLLPKNFNALKPLHDEPLTLTLENSVIRVNKTKVAFITNIEEWTTAFTAYMSVMITREPFRSAELLEYLSLIRYAAKYHRGLGWCVYDNKFALAAQKNANATDLAVGGITQGSSASVTMIPKNTNHSQVLESSTLDSTTTSSFGSTVSPVNVHNQYQALSHHLTVTL